MYDSLIAIVFIFCIIAVYKNIFKTYKIKHTSYKIVLGLGLLLISYVLATIFVILLNLNSLFSIICTGIFSEIIALVIYLKHLKNNSKKKSKIYKSTRLELILTIIIPLIIIIILVSANFSNTISCNLPNAIVGNTDCCVPNYDYGVVLCSDEVKKLNEQLILAIKSNIITTKTTETFLSKFSLLLPEGYFAVRNAKAGLFDYPLILMSYDEYEDSIQIIVMYSESVNYYGQLKEIYPEIKKGLIEGSTYSTFSEPVFLKNKEKGTETVVFKSVNKQNEFEIFISTAFVKKDNKLVAIKYVVSSKELYDYYHNEFEDMVASVNIIE